MQNVGTAQRGTKRGYGSTWKKWLLIYLVAGAVIYAIVYFVFLYHSGGYGSGGGLGGGGGNGRAQTLGARRRGYEPRCAQLCAFVCRCISFYFLVP